MIPPQPMPQPGVDYPQTWSQFLEWFHSEDACRAFLEHLRWPAGFVCPKWAVLDTPCRSTRGRIMCRHCKFQASVTAGSIFDKTRTELRVWFAAVWYVTNQKQGVSALGLQRVLGLGSFETAWTVETKPTSNLSSRKRWRPGPKCTVTVLVPTERSRISGLTTKSRFIWAPISRPTSRCQASTGWRPCFSAG